MHSKNIEIFSHKSTTSRYSNVRLFTSAWWNYISTPFAAKSSNDL